MSKSKTFILVDGSSYLFRAYHALPPLTTASGQPTGAIYGVINMLKRLIKDHDPIHMAVIFDPKGKTTRHDKFPEYKANRSAMPDELQLQIKPLHKIIKALGMPLIVEDGIEADDVIGTLATKASQDGFDVLISTGDKDMAQLVCDNITLVNTMQNKNYDIQGVTEKYGVPPKLIIDYLALIGDTSDNIPGVPKVGPKTAVKWLNQFGSLDQIIEQADEITGKVGEYLRTAIAEDVLRLAKELVTIDLNIPLPSQPCDLKLTSADNNTLKTLFKELEFSNWLRDLGPQDSAASEIKPQETNYELILTQDGFEHWLEKIKKADCFAFDTETTSLDTMEAKLVGISVAIDAGEAAYIPVAHDYMGAPEQLELDRVLTQLQPLLNDSSKTMIGQNLKYDLKVLRNHAIDVKNILWDTMLASYVLKKSGNRHDLDTLARVYLNKETISFTDIAGKGAKQLTFNQIDLEQAAPYAAEDADITLQLYQHFNPQLESGWAQKIFNSVEMPLLPILIDMEYTGVLIDSELLLKQSAELSKKINLLQSEIFKIAQTEFNINSPKQLQTVLFEKCQLPIIKKTPKGQPSTAESVLQQLADNYPLPQLILDYRHYAKLKSTYTDKLPKQVLAKTGRIHTNYNQTGTATGRLSSNNPNLQNIPIRTEEGRKIRKAFIAPPEHCILAADYSQIELRIMAHLSKDPGLLNAFNNDIDVHTATAAEVFNVAKDQVTTDQRRSAKAINFGLMYGMSAFGLSQQLNIPRDQAQQYMDIYFARYPNVQQYMEQTREYAAEHGFVETILGRRIYTPDINAKNGVLRKSAQRAAINAPLQGSSAEIIKLAMISIHQWLPSANNEVSLLMQVHDELVFAIKESALDAARSTIKSKMENAYSLDVPLLVSVDVGPNWEAAH